MSITTIPQLKAWLRANLLPTPPAAPRSNSATKLVSVLETMLDLLANNIRGDRGEQGVRGETGPPGTITQYSSLNVTGDFTVDGRLRFPATNQQRRLELFPGSNDHEFVGFGTRPNELAYQVANLNNAHVWYVGVNAASSRELMRLLANGRLGVGTSAPEATLEISAVNPAGGEVARLTNMGSSGRTGIKQVFHQAGIAIWRIGQPGGADAFVIEGYDVGNYPERMRIDSIGNMGVGTNAPTARMHLKASNGYNQFRLETAYTPTGSNDPNGNVGDICFDDNYGYRKTTTGWKRWALSNF